MAAVGENPRRRCRACGSTVTLRYGTGPTTGWKAEPVHSRPPCAPLAEGTSLRATRAHHRGGTRTRFAACWIGVPGSAGRHPVVMAKLAGDGVPTGELWSFIHTKHKKTWPVPKSTSTRMEMSGYGLAFAPVWRLVLGFVIGNHDQTQADRLVEQVAW